LVMVFGGLFGLRLVLGVPRFQEGFGTAQEISV